MTPNIKQLLAKLDQQGFILERLEHGYFKIEPSEKLTPEQRQYLTDHAEAITDGLQEYENITKKTHNTNILG